MIRQPISWPSRVTLGIASLVLVMAVYTSLSYRQRLSHPQDRTIPSWGQISNDGVVRALQSQHGGSDDSWLWADSKASLVRLFGGIAIGATLAIVVGVLTACYSSVESFCLPMLAFLSKLPPTAMLAVLFVMAGTGYEMYVAMIAFGVFPTMTQSVFHSARDVPSELIWKSYTLGASNAECIWDVIIKQILPRLVESIRSQIGPAMVYLVAAEMLVGDVGFGYRIKIQSRLLDMSVVYVYLAILGVAGLVMDFALVRLRQRLCPWYAQ